ncbi:MAG: WxcM-like domain-containing protein [Candidatus Aenigmarchaeota archaeon]|nr:WxcM-like domain-containing protein [Candidatus Aenigmarchaeota archaeon]
MNENTKLKIELVHEDARGQIFTIEENGKEISSIEGYKKGAPRGGHFHPYPEEKKILSGSIKCYVLNPKTKKEKIVILKNGDRIVIPPNFPHLFLGVSKNSVFLSIINSDSKKYKATDYEPYRKKVDKFLKNI